MCGIVGFTGGPKPELLRAMCASIRHRGPDDEGFFESSAASLGMRRLAIVDITGGRQPIFNESREIAAVCNGEIYNFRDLRRDLTEAGHRLHATHSDTEVCPHAYEEWGANWVSRVNGMFGAAIWDGREKALYLYRDRLGKKPLYYAMVGRDIVFASEIKALLVHPEVPREPDYAALGAYFACKAVPGERTAYRNIFRLPPASVLRWQDGLIEIRPYWQSNFSPIENITTDEAAAEVLRLLTDSVNLRMQCDVPFGAYLSGGVDSSAVAVLMARIHNRPVKTFCLGYADGSGSQMEGKSADVFHARRMSSLLGSEHHELFITSADFAAAMPKILQSFDQPFSGTISTFFLSELIKRHVTVAISGDGSDELFASYLTHRLSFPISRYLADVAYFDTDGAALSDLAPFDSPAQFNFLRRTASPVQSVWYDRLSVFTQAERRDLLSKEVFPELAFANPYQAFDGHYTATDALNRTLELDQHCLLPDQILPFVDQLSMAHSVEVRCPFLDYRLVEFVNRLPGGLKITGGVNKYILKTALHGVLPPEVLERPKEGFVQPIYTWMRQELREWAREALAGLPAALFNAGCLSSLITDWEKGRPGLEAKIWNLICFSIWWNEARYA